MGLFSDIKKLGRDVFDPSDMLKSVSGQAGAEAIDEATRVQSEQFNRIFDLQKPFAEAGIEQLPFLSESATAEGFGDSLGSILNTNSPLNDARANLARRMFNRSGLNDRESAVTSASKLEANDALDLEAEMNRRRQGIAGIGFSGTSDQANALENLGATQAGGTLGVAQANAQGAGNMGALLGSILQNSGRRG